MQILRGVHMNILVIDAQGGGIGRQLIQSLKKNEYPDVTVIAAGTNSIATSNMLKAGADIAVTGENPIVVCSRTADVIIGPIGIVIADALYGEITPVMAKAIAQSKATRLLIPINKCDNIVIGVDDLSVSHLIDLTLDELSRILA
ncbi:MAG: DUF3842 family protein [Erysipelotrichaceae bacterium]|nr:DUF3842 family protein [Erysipelotrichaceae bacterium]